MKIHSLLGSVIFVCSSLAVAPTAFCADSASVAQNVTTKSASKSVATKNTKKKQEVAANSAMVVDLKTNEVLYSSNPHAVMPIASVTKLMTAMVTLDAKLAMDEKLTINISDTKEMKGVYSRVRIGSEISRKEMLLLTLMSSENRAAASLAHHYPGGHKAFIKAMNAKAKALGMKHTRYVEPTGLSHKNVSSASDLVVLLKASQGYPLLGQLSSTEKKTVTFAKPRYSLDFRNTNRLVYKDNWDIQLTKTGFTNAAGHCLVMRTEMAKRQVAFVVLDAYGKYTHLADANRLRNWLETGKVTPIPAEAKQYKKQRSKQQLAKVSET
ncbi:MAG: D-alanyl-D-alanine endopeptidase [Shewanella sp.]